LREYNLLLSLCFRENGKERKERKWYHKIDKIWSREGFLEKDREEGIPF